MGQLLILIGGDEEHAALLEQGRSILADLAGTDLIEEHSAAGVSVLRTAKLYKPSATIARDESTSTWACGVGTWFHESQGPHDTLTHLMNAFRSGPTEFEGALDGIDGSFLLAVGDPRRGKAAVVTDRVGTIHGYATVLGATRLIATSSLVLAALRGAEWDPTGVREFVSTGSVFEERSLFRGISKLRPASAYRYDLTGREATSRYWNFDDIAYAGRAPEESVRRLGGALHESLEMVSRSYDRLLLDLTGGYDSRAVVAAMTRLSPRFETVVNGNDDSPDVIVANTIADSRGLVHHHQKPRASVVDWWRSAKRSLGLCDGECDILEYARTLENHRRMIPDHDVTVNGSGGEFCKGYWWELLLPRPGSSSSFDARRVAAARFATDPWGDTVIDTQSGSLTEHFTGVIERATTGLGGRPGTVKMDKVYLVVRMQRWQGRIASATNRLWPCVSPFMFRGVMEAAFSARPRVRFGNQMIARLIESLDPALAAMPLTMGYPALPMRVTNLHRFAPLVGDFAQSLWRKIRPRRGKMLQGPRPDAELWSSLLKLDEARSLLELHQMRTKPLYREDTLRDFINAVLSGGDYQRAHLGRVLTLEHLARHLADRGRRI